LDWFYSIDWFKAQAGLDWFYSLDWFKAQAGLDWFYSLDWFKHRLVCNIDVCMTETWLKPADYRDYPLRLLL